MKVQVGLRLEVSMLERIDQERGLVPRNAWIEHKLEKLFNQESKAPIKPSGVSVSSDPPHHKFTQAEVSKPVKQEQPRQKIIRRVGEQPSRKNWETEEQYMERGIRDGWIVEE